MTDPAVDRLLSDIAARVVWIREALEVGAIGAAAAVAADLEHDVTDARARLAEFRSLDPAPLRTCPRCGASFRWPGELDHHRAFVCRNEDDVDGVAPDFYDLTHFDDLTRCFDERL